MQCVEGRVRADSQEVVEALSQHNKNSDLYQRILFS